MILLDTQILVWFLVEPRKLRSVPFLEHYTPWLVSPVSLLEIRFLVECGRFGAKSVELQEALTGDPRFTVDDLPLLALVRHALDCGWTRDPFDRLITAHSLARRVPLCALDRRILTHHPLIVPELRPERRRRR